MKELIIFILVLININTAKCQKETLKLDSIQFSKVCFGGLCLGNPTKKMYKILGKPKKIIVNDNKGEMEDNPIPVKVYLFSRNNINIIGIEELMQKNTVNKIYNIGDNKKFNFNNSINISDPVDKIGRLYPNSYKIAMERKQISKEGNGRIELKIYGQPKGFERITGLVFEIENFKVSNIHSEEEY
jgi:hypothetical protein